MLEVEREKPLLGIRGLTVQGVDKETTVLVIRVQCVRTEECSRGKARGAVKAKRGDIFKG